MRNTFLEFEQPLAELEGKIEELRYVQSDSAVDISEELSRLQQKSQTLAKNIYAKLTPWQTALVARHPQRPYTLDYVNQIFSDFHELHGDALIRLGCPHFQDRYARRQRLAAARPHGRGRQRALRELELLAREQFDTLLEAKVLIERWRREYNTRRPHTALKFRVPAEVHSLGGMNLLEKRNPNEPNSPCPE